MLIKKNTLSPFDWFLIVGVISSCLLYSFYTRDFDIIGMTASITGLICVVLCAKGNILNYLFGFINVTLYAYISFKSELYGDAALNAFYYLPMQFIGWFSWSKRKQEKDETKVKARVMTPVQRFILFAVCALSVAVTGFILTKTGDPQPYKDAATTILSVIAMWLMVKAFMEQWFLWIATNIISVAMWSILTLRGEPHAEMMVIMWGFYLANSINGLIQWHRLSKNN